MEKKFFSILFFVLKFFIRNWVYVWSYLDESWFWKRGREKDKYLLVQVLPRDLKLYSSFLVFSFILDSFPVNNVIISLFLISLF